ncbi:hypothetical protein [Gordonia sp. NPDC003422]
MAQPQQFHGQPQFGQPQFGGPQFGGQPPSSGSGKVIGIAVGAVVIAVALVVTLSIVFWPGGDDDAGSTTKVTLTDSDASDSLDVTLRAPKGWKFQETPGDSSIVTFVPKSETHTNAELQDLFVKIRRGDVVDIDAAEAVSIAVKNCAGYGGKFEAAPTAGAGWKKSKSPITSDDHGYSTRQDAAIIAATAKTCLLVIGYDVAKSTSQLSGKPRQIVDDIADGKYVTRVSQH